MSSGNQRSILITPKIVHRVALLRRFACCDGTGAAVAVAAGRITARFAILDAVRRHGHDASSDIWSLDHRSGHPSYQMQINMAVKEPYLQGPSA